MEPIPIAVRIEINAPFPLREQIERLSDAELGILREDLALPLLVSLEVVVTEPSDNRHSDTQVRVYVDDTELRLPQAQRLNDRAVEDFVLSALHAHREAFITPRLADALWASWAESETECPAQFTLLLRRLVKNHIRIDRVADAVKGWSKSTPQTAFEMALSQTSRLIRILFHAETAAEYETKRASYGSFQGEAQEPISMMIDGLFYELGIHIGDCQLVGVPALSRNEWRVAINDLRGRLRQTMPDGEILVNDTVDRLSLLEIKGRETINPANGNECAFIPSEDVEVAEDAGLTTWDGLGYVILATSAEVRSNAYALLSMDGLEFLLSKLEGAWPELVELTRSRIGEQRFVEILRLLLEEEITIRNMRLIIETLLILPSEPYIGLDKFILFSPLLRPEVVRDTSMAEADIVEAAEAVRIALKQYISHKYTRGQNTLIVYLLDPKLEELVQESTTMTIGDLAPIMRAIRIEVGSLPPTRQNPVILTTANIRSKFQRMIKPEFPHLHVLSYQELSPDMNIQPIARITLE